MPHRTTGAVVLRAVLAAALLAFVILLLASCSAPVRFGAASPSGADATVVTIIDAIDGDTLSISAEVHGCGTVRLIGIDTPRPTHWARAQSLWGGRRRPSPKRPQKARGPS